MIQNSPQKHTLGRSPIFYISKCSNYTNTNLYTMEKHHECTPFCTSSTAILTPHIKLSTLPSHILYQNASKTITLFDIPRSIEDAQYLSERSSPDTGSSRRLLSCKPVDKPYNSLKPKSKKALRNAPTKCIEELMLERYVKLALDEMREGMSEGSVREWCLDRIFEEDGGFTWWVYFVSYFSGFELICLSICLHVLHLISQDEFCSLLYFPILNFLPSDTLFNTLSQDPLKLKERGKYHTPALLPRWGSPSIPLTTHTSQMTVSISKKSK